MTASFLTYPLDLIRTVLSVNVDNPNQVKPSIIGVGKEIFARDGIRGLYRGLPATLYVSRQILGSFRASHHTLVLKCLRSIF